MIIWFIRTYTDSCSLAGIHPLPTSSQWTWSKQHISR
jgi:hypothetical protein